MLRHFVLPHPKTHRKAHLISFKALVVYFLLFALLLLGFKGLSFIKPNILGITSDINQQDLIRITNEQRQKNGLPALAENKMLDQAAEEKAKNMFAENYWAHYSPSGKDPWGFITGAGYKFSFAGENLARNYYTSNDVVDAWMASKMGHKENLLNSRYKEVGMAVVEGTLNGQKTILVVQEFGTPYDGLASKPSIDAEAQKVAVNTKQPALNIPVSAVAKTESQTLGATDFKFDPFAVGKIFGFGILGIVGLLLLIDMLVIYLIRRRPLYHFAYRHAPHMALLSFSASSLVHLIPGTIL